MKFASLILLAYKRPQMLTECLDTLHKTLDYPAEIIVNVDGEDNPDQHAASIAYGYFREKKISKLISVGGNNRGVGRSFQNALGVAEGDFIFKIDTDIIFKPNWLSKAVKCLEDNPDVGSVGLFDYHRQDPNDERFKPENNVLETRPDCLIVKDFVSSIWGLRRQDLNGYMIGAYGSAEGVPDDGMHQSVGEYGCKRALIDVVDNKAWGVGKSVYLSGTAENPSKTQTFNEPLVFKP